jgi:hypothetical protein
MHFFKGIFLRNSLQKKPHQNQIKIKLFHIQITETSIFAPYGLLKQVVLQYPKSIYQPTVYSIPRIIVFKIQKDPSIIT